MKHKLQTLLKHKLQWLLLLAALLGVSQGVWADDNPNKTFYVSSKDNDNYKLHLWKSDGSECKTWKSPDELMTKLNSKFNRNYFSYDYSSCSAIDRFKVYHDGWTDGSGDQTFPTDGRNIYDIQTGKLGYYFPDAMSNIILKGILEVGKVTCYVGCSWSRGDESSDKWRIFLNTANSTSNWYLELPSNATFDMSSKTNRYSAAMTASNVQYWITDDPGWSGAQMPSGTVAGNAYILGSNGDHVCGDGDDGDRVCVLTGASYSKAYFGSDNTATSLSITEGTASVTLTSTCSGTTSAIGTALKYHYYLKNGSGDYTLIGTKDVNATSALELTYNTSSLAEGTYYIYPLLVDATNATVAVRPSSGNGDVLTLTVTASCTPPSALNFTVEDNTLTYNGTAQSATVSSSDTDVYDPASITVKYGASAATAAVSQTDANTYNIYVTAASESGDFCAITEAIDLEVDLTIAPVTPSSSNKGDLFTITGVPAELTFDGSSHAATVAWKSPYSSTGERTIYYKKGSADATTDAPVDAGTYAVTLRVAAGTNNAASESDISLGDIVISKASQATVSIDNAGNYCVGSSVTANAIGGSGTGAYSFTKVSGTEGITITSGGVIEAANEGTITINATKAADDNYNASAASSNVTFTFLNAPTAYTLSVVGGSTTICSSGGTLKLSDSQSGYTYQLKKDGENIGDPVAGDGDELEFGVDKSGEYTCEAYLTGSPSCKTTMTGAITLHISLTPSLMPASPTVKSYEPLTITSINTDVETWTISDAGNTAYLYGQTPNTITFKALSDHSPYTVTATTRGGCSAEITVTVVNDTDECD